MEPTEHAPHHDQDLVDAINDLGIVAAITIPIATIVVTLIILFT